LLGEISDADLLKISAIMRKLSTGKVTSMKLGRTN
jgi:hypothetical protein